MYGWAQVNIKCQIADIESIRKLSDIVKVIGDYHNVWEIQFFKPGGKWAYTDYIVMEKPVEYIHFKDLIQHALDTTPNEIRLTNIRNIDDWTVVMINNPLGFPIMVNWENC